MLRGVPSSARLRVSTVRERRRDYTLLQVRRVLCYRKNDEEDEEVREVSERIGCALYESANYKN